MTSRSLFLGSALSAILIFSGCVPLWVGALGVGVVGGYAVSPDTVEGTIPFSLGETYDSAKEIVSIMGALIEDNENTGSLVAMINGSRVTVSMLTINASTTKISVKARKSFMPKIDLAQDVYAKILNNLTK